MKKKLIILFCILAFLALMITLNSAVFSVRSIKAVLKNADDPVLCQKIKDNVKIESRSIFFLDESKIIQNLSLSVPEAKILKIERKFPDKLVIHAAKRARIGYIKYDNVYYIISEELTVIDIINARPNNLIELLILDDVDMSAAEKGRELEINDTAKNDLINLFYCIKNIGEEYFKLVQKINYVRKSGDFYLKTTSGVVIHLSFSERLQEKVQIAFSLYNYSPLYRSSGIISAYLDKDGKLKASYRPGEIDF
ncbi:MAG TPA: hypothetical protein VIL23_04490 [Clostridia bacterium]